MGSTIAVLEGIPARELAIKDAALSRRLRKMVFDGVPIHRVAPANRRSDRQIRNLWQAHHSGTGKGDRGGPPPVPSAIEGVRGSGRGGRISKSRIVRVANIVIKVGPT